MDATEAEDKLLQAYLSEPLVREIGQNPNEDMSICATITLMSLFGPEKITINGLEGYKNELDFWNTVERFGNENNWSYYIPGSAYDFAAVMLEEGVVGAIVAMDVYADGKGELGHVMAILGSWTERKEKPQILDRYLIVYDSASLFGGQLMEVDFDDLVEIYARSKIADDGSRDIVVFLEV